MDTPEREVSPPPAEEDENKKRVIIILEGAHLQLIETKRYIYELANIMKHKHLLRDQKNEEEMRNFRPDILHQCLIHLLESALNKYGLLQVYIKTHDNQLFYVSSHLKIPKTYDQFESLMVTFLRKYKIKANEKNLCLLKFLKNDYSAILPINGKKIGLSVKGKKVHFSEYVQNLQNEDVPVTFFIGAVAYSNPITKLENLDDNICISEFSLSAATCCSTICSEFENLLGLF
ncbi:ribosomal RNA small subunit methyltransferase NEP1, putative [Plasmodium knowlesi strain H]|uniref:Ribosomal RNA small subunit methyltransferase NEP1, putative n=3 Tax=Plasmodium knowlesi TaxID=5850 RepID=A0A5K1UNI0_PLAKH|nr:ribosome biogenesis protein nep1-like protein [Plasmodium knowlesi strain H]OTN67935.1 putative Ribosomal RNA small subunit methyltransferase NEP1 [Plasmodium knowlesi]CAA9990193.1 ribosomal RNA small subunit methyltransferase NEP1, putative [Plasmodium knowlesi strain H]SBO27476.1 ribosomal RNA small subunit methyltransferase NEP1, putative [Plasmodium knowlesi strain H]SBO28483.1 ribosomal RNA small subunit methyltransferase NEP1, putative [Plasmodium knowlesi strain H]VVS79667.1 ribosoma|eukprot:XP_002258108.1 ribosome biogenesis protein nep1-like protein [Plasmodium knowlesi strain H]